MPDRGFRRREALRMVNSRPPAAGYQVSDETSPILVPEGPPGGHSKEQVPIVLSPLPVLIE